MGSRFPMGMPPMPNGGGGPALNVASPMNDLQMLWLASCIFSANEPPIDFNDTAARDAQANRSTRKAIDHLAVAAYYMNLGTPGQQVEAAQKAGHAARLKALEAEKPSEPEAPPSRIITEE